MKIYLLANVTAAYKKENNRDFLEENNLTIIIDANDGKGKNMFCRLVFVKEVSLFSVLFNGKVQTVEEIICFPLRNNKKKTIAVCLGFFYNNGKSQCNFPSIDNIQNTPKLQFSIRKDSIVQVYVSCYVNNT